ncbi:hypothetical protein [Pseudomonas benzenivorans]|uniref:Uncharacterized protein n=1 Tax=Pseudomonas benzenivorans TaxID=556533 RepID=A0ABY5HC43_9PSED|nr:hypothetical protein [Pseudomonas benzenivorans]UTW09669.1 hypothetical protein KDW96_10340 [Pseudomonas benzenivorans]
MTITRRLMVRLSRGLLHLAAFLSRRPSWQPISDRYLQMLARKVIKASAITPARDLHELGKRWQLGFSSIEDHPIIAVTDDTVYAEISTDCPLRGSADTAACYRMMEYDRTLLEHIGGEFVVLRSQAQPGVSRCQVAMRRRGADMSDLIPAHINNPSH